MQPYSSRLAWEAPINTFSQLLATCRAAGQELLDLTVSNPTEALADYPHAAIGSALGSVKDFAYLPDAFGIESTRAEIVRRFNERQPGLTLSADQVALTASTSEAYGLLFKLLANPGDDVLVPAPSYPLFDYLARLEGLTLRPYALRYDGSWFLDFESLEAALSARSRALIVVNPNNPTGSFLHAGEYVRVRDFAVRHSLALISDEVFMDYAFGESNDRIKTLAGQQEVLSFALNGLSKAAGMPQMKLGWVVVSGPPDVRQQACKRLELVLDTYLSVGTPVQLAIGKLLLIGDDIQRRLRRRIENNLATLGRLLSGERMHRLHSEGGWSAILRVPQTLSEEAWITRLLQEHQVVVQPGYFFDMPQEAYLVVSLITPEETFAEGIRRLLILARTH